MGITATSLSTFGALVTTTLAGAFPATITIGTASYACAWVPGPRGREAVVNGQIVRIDGTVRIPFTELAASTPPAARAVVTIDGTTYRITTVTTRAHEGSHALDVEQPNR